MDVKSKQMAHRDDGNNHIKGKNYAAGVLPVCVNGDDGTVHVLLGLQPKGVSGKAEAMTASVEGKGSVTGVWCVFWGWQDKGDADEEDSAAREASEESAGLLGAREDVRAFLIAHPESRVWPCLYVLFLGVMSAEHMQAVCDEFYFLRWSTFGLKVCEREMSAVKFFPLSAIEASCQKGDRHVEGMVKGKQQMRKFLHDWLVRTVRLFSEDPLFVSLRGGGANQVTRYPYLMEQALPCGRCGIVMKNHERKYRKQRCNACWDQEKKGL